MEFWVLAFFGSAALTISVNGVQKTTSSSSSSSLAINFAGSSSTSPAATTYLIPTTTSSTTSSSTNKMIDGAGGVIPNVHSTTTPSTTVTYTSTRPPIDSEPTYKTSVLTSAETTEYSKTTTSVFSTTVLFSGVTDSTVVETIENSTTHSSNTSNQNSSDATDVSTTVSTTVNSNTSITSAHSVTNSTAPNTPTSTPSKPSTTTANTTSVTTVAPLKCENNGTENNGFCICSESWTGKDCSEKNFCEGEKHNGFTFSKTIVGFFAYSKEKCSKDTSAAGKPNATVKCVKLSNGSTAFELPIQVLDCFLTLNEIQLNITDPLQLEQQATNTQILTSVPQELTPENITFAARLVNQLLNSTNSTEKTKVAAIATVSQLLSANATDDDGQREATSKLTVTLENLSVNLGRDNNSSKSNIVQPNLVLQSAQVPAKDTLGVQFSSFAGESGSFIGDRIQLNPNVSQVEMGNQPADALIFINFTTATALRGSIRGQKSASNVSLGFVLYQNDRFFRTEGYNNQQYSVRVLAGKVIGEWVEPHHVELHFKPTNKTPLYDYACVFWDEVNKKWSTSGCNKISSTNGTLGCLCNHTTNFAALWSYRENYQYKYLDIVSTTGLAISTVALVITIVHHLKENLCKTARERQVHFHANMVLLYIYSTLLVFILIFLCGTKNYARSYERQLELDLQTNNIPESSEHVERDAGPCTAVTALLHYFLLATFVWNSIYGTQLVLLIRSLRNRLPSYWNRLSYAVGWGLPAIIMAVTLGVTYRVDTPLNYRQEEFCWLAGMNKNNQFDFAKPMFWGFLLPVGLILVYNLILLIVTAVTMCKIDPKLRSTKKTTLRKKFLVCFSLAVLLGLSWSLGYLVLVSKHHANTVLSIIFCICQTTQGVQIFIFFTARTPTFRAAMKHCGQTINSAFFARVQTYHLWKNFKKALSFESYRNWDSGRTGCPNTIDTNTSSQ